MGIRSWWERFRKREDEKELERDEELALETPEERRISSGDIEALQADERTARFAGETAEDAQRLGDGE